jgi:hypothetical protein
MYCQLKIVFFFLLFQVVIFSLAAQTKCDFMSGDSLYSKKTTIIIRGHKYLFVQDGEKGGTGGLWMWIYLVDKSNPLKADTIILKNFDLAWKDDGCDRHVIVAADYEIKDNKIVFYNYSYYWDELRSTTIINDEVVDATHQNPKLYTTYITEYEVKPDGRLREGTEKYGQQDSEMKNRTLNRKIMKKLKHRIALAEFWDRK